MSLIWDDVPGFHNLDIANKRHKLLHISTSSMDLLDIATSPNSMNTVDLLSAPSGGDQGDGNLQISEDTNRDEAAMEIEVGGAPSLLPLSAAPQHPAAAVDSAAIYQIDFDVEHIGKNKPQSKRMAAWKYGLQSSGGGTIAGHQARLIWSTHSGKYTISVDGEDIFSGVAKGSVLSHKWKWSHSKCCVIKDDEGNSDSVTMRVIACRKPPIRSSKNFRCYEFIIGGRVFRDLPVNGSDGSSGGEFENEESLYEEEGKLMSILDIIEPGWRAAGFA